MRLLAIIALLCTSALPARAALLTSYFYNVDVATNLTTHGSITLGGDTRSTWPAAILDYTAVTVPIGGDVTPSFTNILVTNMLAGVTNDLWTCPADKIAYLGSATFFNSTNTSASITPNTFVKTNGSYFRVSGAAAAATTNNPVSVSSLGNEWLNPSETFAVTNSASGAFFYGTFKLYPTNTALKCFRILGLTNTAVLLYTVPSDKIAVPYTSGNTSPANSGVVRCCNNPSVTTFYTLWVVPQGAAADDSTLARQSPASNGAASLSGIPMLAPGTSLWVKSSVTTAGQTATFIVYELTPP